MLISKREVFVIGAGGMVGATAAHSIVIKEASAQVAKTKTTA